MSVDIALIDSGVNAGHSHVGRVAGGLAFHPGPNRRVRLETDFGDSIGHGTAVAAIIHERAPRARIHALKIFHHALQAPVFVLGAALDWAINRNIKIIHLSLGTRDRRGKPRLERLCRLARDRNLVVIAAAPSAQDPVYPSCLETTIGVYWHRACGGDRLLYHPDNAVEFGASGLARPLPGVPPDLNFRGSSFAAARVTARAALLLESNPAAGPDWVRERLIASATRVPAPLTKPGPL